MPIGVFAGLVTCALWGLTFVAPRAVAPFSAVDLTVARYGLFGLVSALMMLAPRFRPTGIPARHIVIAVLLGGVGYTGYFICAAFAVQWAGAAVPPLIIGLMPVVLALLANWREGTVPWGAIAMPLAMIAAGVLIVDWAAVAKVGSADRETILFGILAAVSALTLWVVYGVVNAAVMRAADAPDELGWTGLQGLGAAMGSAVLLPLTDFARTPAAPAAALENFLAWASVMGLAGSWLATWCWGIASRRLPLALAAQLIVAETIFGLAYGFLYEGRWPSPVETAGCVLQIVGVGFAIAIFAGSRRFRSSPAGCSVAFDQK